MNLKSYFAATVESAMASAVKELGSEAMLVYSRETSAEARNLGRYEVVFGWESTGARETASIDVKEQDEVTAPPILSARPAGERAVTGRRSGVRDGSHKSAKKDQKKGSGKTVLGRLARFAVSEAKASADPVQSTPPAGRDTQLDPLMARQPGRGISAESKPSEASPAHWRRALSDRIETVLQSEGFSAELSGWIAGRLAQELDVNSPRPGFWTGLAGRIPLAPPEEEGKVAAIVVAGPAGVGKTACLEKLVFRLGLARGREVHLVSTDSLRICGGQRLGRFADLTGARYSLATGAEALEAIIRSEPPGSLLLIEAGGWLSEGGAVWTALRKRNPVVQVHLMLPVALRPEDLNRQFRRFASLTPDYLVLARADESDQTGALCSLAAEKQLAFSYLLSAGSRPESLETATLPRLLASVLNKAAGKEGRLAPTDNLSV